MGMGLDYVVKQIRVLGSLKNWSDPGRGILGASGGSEFDMTVIPQDLNQAGWSPYEAEAVAFDLRMRIHTILMADAQKRGIPLPLDAQTTLIQYRQEVERLRANLGNHTDWIDADIPPPTPVSPASDISGS
jgi:hypothetical protein